MRKELVFSTALLLASLAAPTFAQAYDNGPGNGNTDGWTINFGFAVSDTFTTAGGPLIGLQFGAWLFPGDVLQSVEVLVGTSEYGNDISDQVVTITQSGNCPINTFGYAICTESGNFNASPAAGTYWLTLQNAVVNTGDPVYWDENSGPSSASENSVGTIPSEAFTVGFCSAGGPASPDCGPPTVPEPGSLLLFGSGAVTLFGSGLLRLLRGMRR